MKVGLDSGLEKKSMREGLDKGLNESTNGKKKKGVSRRKLFIRLEKRADS